MLWNAPARGWCSVPNREPDHHETGLDRRRRPFHPLGAGKDLAREGVAFKSFASATEALARSTTGRRAAPGASFRHPHAGAVGAGTAAGGEDPLPAVPVIIMTAYSDLESAVAAFQGGAFEYPPKPFDVDQAVELIRRAIDESMHQDGASEEVAVAPEILGQAPPCRKSSAPSAPCPVPRHRPHHWRIGERQGVGGARPAPPQPRAENLRRHQYRGDPERPARTGTLRSRAGAFTGAQAQRRGCFEQADGGTLFLDEIGDMPPSSRPALRVLSDGILPGRRPFADQGQRPRHRRDPPEPRRPGSGTALPGRPLPPAQRHPHPPAAPARAARGHPPTCHFLQKRQELGVESKRLPTPPWPTWRH